MVSLLDIVPPSSGLNSTGGLFLAIGLVVVGSALVLFLMRRKKRK